MSTNTLPGNTYRFFVPPDAIQGAQVYVSDPDLAHQLRRVLRLQPGSRVLLLDGQGTAYTVILTDLGRDHVAGEVAQQQPAAGEPAITLTLYVALLRPERFEWVLQKGTELGARRFVPLLMERSLGAEQAGERKLTRWRRIIREAAEQACRGRLPDLAPPLPFAEGCAEAATSDLALLLWEGGPDHDPTPMLRAVLRAPATNSSTTRLDAAASVAVLSGPVGGITTPELTTASAHGMIPVSLGPRLLRAETAPIAAAAAIFYESGREL
jgi:16S rRNA (uracil1498-N3)-methyltransferase